jgi:chromosome segregation ATPase|tara:strand:+ start:424 stop:1422 length:999 start_codon:yes stop_codon:yes gene_type:complete
MRADEFIKRPKLTKRRPKLSPQQVIIGDDTIESKLRSELDRLKYIESERDTWKAQVEALTGDVKRLGTENQNQRGEIKGYLDEYAALKIEATELSGIKLKSKEYESDIEKFKINFDALESKFNEINNVNKTLIIDEGEAKAQIEVDKASIDSQQIIISSLRGDKATLEEKINSQEIKAENLQNRELSLNEREKQFKDDNKVFEVEIDFLKNQIEFYNELKNKFDAELSLATTELASANENLNWSELVTSSLVKEVNGGKQDLGDAQALNEEMREIIDTLENRMSRLRRQAVSPVYMSVSMIEKMEGFSMPKGMTPIKNGLGTGRPTLFKKAG